MIDVAEVGWYEGMAELKESVDVKDLKRMKILKAQRRVKAVEEVEKSNMTAVF